MTVSRIPDRTTDWQKKSRIPCPNFGESRFPVSSQIPNPVRVFCVFPNPASFFGQHFQYSVKIGSIRFLIAVGLSNQGTRQKPFFLCLKKQIHGEDFKPRTKIITPCSDREKIGQLSALP